VEFKNTGAEAKTVGPGVYRDRIVSL
jgi:hypothetical protein